MATSLIVLVAAVLIAVGIGVWRVATNGRFRRRVGSGSGSADPAREDAPAASVLAGTAVAGDLGVRATLLQFSSAFCAPCRATRQILAEVARAVPGVAHVEIDAEQNLGLVRRLNVVRTPTTLVLDARGREISRAAGAPAKAAVLSALSEAVSTQ